jgi:dihydroxyacetone kinase
LAISKGDNVVVLINNLGAISDLEMGILVNESIKQLTENYSVKVERIFAGRFMTSLEMSGFSLTVLKLSSDLILDFVDAETRTVGWSGNSFVRKIGPVVTIPDPLTLEKYVRQKKIGPESDSAFQDGVKRAVDVVCDALVASENELNQVPTQEPH